MSAWLSKWAPASGVLAGVLAAISFFGTPTAPGDNATSAQVIGWYQSHHTSDFVSDLLGGVAIAFLVLFAVALARQVRDGERWLAHGALAGAVFGGMALLTTLGVTPNTSMIGALVAIALARLPLPLFRRYRSIHVQNLAQSAISAATFGAANSLLLPIGTWGSSVHRLTPLGNVMLSRFPCGPGVSLTVAPSEVTRSVNT